MRVIAYSSCFVICCVFLSLAEAQNKRIERSKDVDNGSEERYTKYKKEENRKGFKYKNGDDKERQIYEYSNDHTQNCRGKDCYKSNTKNYDDDFHRNDKYLKYTKKINKYPDNSEEEKIFKQRKNIFNRADYKEREKAVDGRYEFKKNPKRATIKVETDEKLEEFVVTKQQDGKRNNGKIKTKFVHKRDEDYIPQDKIKGSRKTTNDDTIDNDENIKKEPINIRKTLIRKTSVIDNNADETPKTDSIKKHLFTHLDDDSDEETTEDNDSDSSEETDESNETEEITGTCRKKSKCPGRNLKNSEDSDETSENNNKPVHRQKIKYSIKFAHEKEKNAPSEDDNILKKIHRGKRNRYDNNDDDDDDSNEEHDHPKRIHYADEDED